MIKQYNQRGEYEELIELDDFGNRAEWMSVVRAEKKGEYKLNVVVEHIGSNTKSRVVVRAIARNGARVNLSGIIKIPEGVSGVDARLELRVLLLDDMSSASVDPQLEIMSDEVKAGHGASVSRIDENQIEYLMSRGIEREDAEEQIVEGWLSDRMWV